MIKMYSEFCAAMKDNGKRKEMIETASIMKATNADKTYGILPIPYLKYTFPDASVDKNTSKMMVDNLYGVVDKLDSSGKDRSYVVSSKLRKEFFAKTSVELGSNLAGLVVDLDEPKLFLPKEEDAIEDSDIGNSQEEFTPLKPIMKTPDAPQKPKKAKPVQKRLFSNDSDMLAQEEEEMHTQPCEIALLTRMKDAVLPRVEQLLIKGLTKFEEAMEEKSATIKKENINLAKENNSLIKENKSLKRKVDELTKMISQDAGRKMAKQALGSPKAGPSPKAAASQGESEDFTM